MNDFPTRTECEIHRENMNKDITNLGKIVRSNQKDIIQIDKSSIEQKGVLNHLSITVEKLDLTLIKVIEVLNENNTDTAINKKTADSNNDMIYKVVSFVLIIIGWGIAIFK